jgi:hypothetical protein
MALYRPPTKGATVQVPWLSMVLVADPDFERRKHREVEYVTSSGKVLVADPYKRGAYNTPNKMVTQAYSGPATFAQGDLTGVGYDFVTFVNTSGSPGVLTMRTAAQMFADIVGAVPNMGYALRIVNDAVASDMTVAPGDSNTLFRDRSAQIVRTFTVRGNTYTDLRVQFPDANDALISVDSEGSPYSALVG